MIEGLKNQQSGQGTQLTDRAIVDMISVTLLKEDATTGEKLDPAKIIYILIEDLEGYLQAIFNIFDTLVESPSVTNICFHC